MELVAIVTALALIEYSTFTFLVGRARDRTGVQAPATTGHPEFERYSRAHQNTAEQLIVFLPALWIFASYVRPDIAAALGALFVIGRLLYFMGYVTEARKRTPGFLIAMLAQSALLLGGLIGAIRALL